MTRPDADVSFTAQRRQALALAADGLFQALRKSEQALAPLGLSCTGHVQGRNAAGVAFAGAWLTEQASGQLLVPLRLELSLTPAASHAADAAVAVCLELAKGPVHDVNGVRLLACVLAPVHAARSEPVNAQHLCDASLQLLETLPFDELAAAVSDALAH